MAARRGSRVIGRTEEAKAKGRKRGKLRVNPLAEVSNIAFKRAVDDAYVRFFEKRGMEPQMGGWWA